RLNNNDSVKTDSVKTQAADSVMQEEKHLEPDTEFVIETTLLRSVLPDEIIDLGNVETVKTKKRNKHDMLYSDSTYPERRRAVKKSRYLTSPYDEAVYESNASKLHKDISTYAWSISHDE
ncbi:Ulp1 protease family C-terminal catalytic domain containing protein, partial [Trifolium pratense]